METNADIVVKGLKCCHTSVVADCKQCPYKGKADYEEDLGITCTNLLIKDALELISKLTEEKYDIETSYKLLKKDNERLINSNLVFAQNVEKVAANYYNIGCTDTAKGIYERLVDKAYTSNDWSHGEHPMVVELDDIDEIVEEFLENK